MRFPNLFQPLTVRGMEIPNRICMPAMDVNLGNEHGEVTDRHVAFLRERAKGGAGLIVVEASHVSADGKLFPHSLGIHHDGLIPGLRRLVEACHEYGAKIAIQINHAGRQTYSKWTGHPLVAPSAVPCPRRQEMPKALTKEEIKHYVRLFGEAAKRAVQAGFDAVEIHGAHGYLISGFMSPHSNLRTDEYGGDGEGRLRFPKEVVREVRAAVGDHYPILFRFSADEFVEGGLTLDDSRHIARQLEAEGVDMLSVSGAVYGSVHMMISPMQIPQGYMVDLAHGIKNEVNIPVISVGRIYEPAFAEDIVASGKSDMVALGRALLADPAFPNKTREGRLEEIAYCVGCLHCVGPSLFTSNIKCLQNLRLGRESEKPVGRASVSKLVLVVGGGLAGLEAARTAARRGHRVILCEGADKLGGQVNIATVPPGKEVFLAAVTHREQELRRLGVDIRTNCKVTIELVRQISPDVIILATGSLSRKPEGLIDGHDQVYTAHEVLEGAVLKGQQIVVVGGGSTGCETADYLADKGYQVTIVHRGEEIAKDINERTRTVLKQIFAERGVTVLTSTAVRSIGNGFIRVEDRNGTRQLPADGVVLALGIQSVADLKRPLEAEGFTVLLAGDANQIGDAMTAVEDGYRIALTV